MDGPLYCRPQQTQKFPPAKVFIFSPGSNHFCCAVSVPGRGGRGQRTPLNIPQKLRGPRLTVGIDIAEWRKDHV